MAPEQADGPVYYAGRAPTDVKTPYSLTERQALAAVWVWEKFREFLYGKPFSVTTDFKPLKEIYSPKSIPPTRTERWALTLQTNSKRSTNPAHRTRLILPRLAVNPASATTGHDEHVCFVAKRAVPECHAIHGDRVRRALVASCDSARARRAVSERRNATFG